MGVEEARAGRACWGPWISEEDGGKCHCPSFLDPGPAS
jgi:hypothetical protein